MNQTLNRPSTVLSKRTPVRAFSPRVQPNPEGGKPTDPLILALEGCLEGLICERDDRVALQQAIAALRSALNVNAMLVRSILAKHVTPEMNRKARGLQDVIARLMTHIEMREERLRTIVDPELQRIVTLTDHTLAVRESLTA